MDFINLITFIARLLLLRTFECSKIPKYENNPFETTHFLEVAVVNRKFYLVLQDRKYRIELRCTG